MSPFLSLLSSWLHGSFESIFLTLSCSKPQNILTWPKEGQWPGGQGKAHQQGGLDSLSCSDLVGVGAFMLYSSDSDEKEVTGWLKPRVLKPELVDPGLLSNPLNTHTLSKWKVWAIFW